jgi:hypothetical protein
MPAIETVKAKYYGSDGNEVANAAIAYSLAAPYAGVSINASTGVVTVEPTAAKGSATVRATYNGFEATATLTLTEKIVKGPQTLTLDTARGTYYDIPIAVRDMPDVGAGVFTVTYDPQGLEAVDLCVAAAGTILSEGAVPGSFVRIIRYDPLEGAIEFVCAGPSPGFSGIVNIIRFRGKESGSAEINIICTYIE